MFYLSPSNIRTLQEIFVPIRLRVIIAWQAKPELKTINFNERRFPDLLY